MMLLVLMPFLVLQVKTLLGSYAASEREKYQELRYEWLLASAKRGVAAEQLLWGRR